MPKINYVTPDNVVTLDVPSGVSLMQAAVSAGLDGIVGECGGNAMCATCHVYVDPADHYLLAPIGVAEDDMLDSTAAPRTLESRLSCQLIAADNLDGITVVLPDSQQ